MRRWGVFTVLLVLFAVAAVALAPRLTARRPPSPEPKAVLASGPAPVEPAPGSDEVLLDPARFDGVRAPDRFRIRFETTEGPFVVEVRREWAPLGADRLYALVVAGFYDGTTFFRVIDGFVAQWGIHPQPAVAHVWEGARIEDDPVVASNTRGRLTFATAGPNTRTTQLYLNLVDNGMLDKMGFAPVGEVMEGMAVVDALNGDYAEGPPRGRGPNQTLIQREGDAYLARFPELDRIVRAVIIP